MHSRDGDFFVASDIGGTFTDTVVLEASGEVRRYKAPSTPANLVDGVLATFDLAAADHGMPRDEFVHSIRVFSHGTTVATNALLQRRGAKTGLLITEGFGDTAAIMRGMKGFGLDESELKNWRHLQKHPSIIERTLVREIPERVDYQGRVMRPLDEEATRRAVRELVAEGVQALAVCLLWCNEHPDHERRVVEIAREEAPELYVSASSEVLPRIGEYSRMMTTAINAYLGPEVSRVTASLDSTLRDAGLPHEPLLMQSNGGLASVRDRRRPSGLLPAVRPGRRRRRLAPGRRGDRGEQRRDRRHGRHELRRRASWWTGGLCCSRPPCWTTSPIAVPSVGVETIGAGGGSIARVEAGRPARRPAQRGRRARAGVLRARRHGADGHRRRRGARPDQPRERSSAAGRGWTARRPSWPYGRRSPTRSASTLEEAAEGIKRIVDSRMADLIRQATVHQGYDPRNFILVAFGGAGPVHAHAFGSGMGVKKVVVPVTASVHSALGIGASDLLVTHEASHAFRTPPGSSGASAHVDAAQVNAVLAAVEDEAKRRLAEQQIDPAGMRTDYFADIRFRFQIHELTVELPEYPLTPEGLDRLVERFIENYELRFGEGSAFTEAGVELVTWRVVVTAGAERGVLGEALIGEGHPEHVRHDRVYFGGWMDAAVYDEDALTPGLSFDGPAIFELSDTNIVVGPGQHAEVDAHGNVLIDTAYVAPDTERQAEEALHG